MMLEYTSKAPLDFLYFTKYDSLLICGFDFAFHAQERSEPHLTVPFQHLAHLILVEPRWWKAQLRRRRHEEERTPEGFFVGTARTERDQDIYFSGAALTISGRYFSAHARHHDIDLVVPPRKHMIRRSRHISGFTSSADRCNAMLLADIMPRLRFYFDDHR